MRLRDAAAFVLAVCVGVAYGVALVWAVTHPDSLSRVGAAMLYTLGGVLAGGIATWLGGGRGSDGGDT